MTDDLRLVEVETKVERIVVILEGEPIVNIDGDITGRQGGMMAQGLKSAEALKRIEALMIVSKPSWSRNQKLAAFGIGTPVVVGLLSSAWSTVRTVAMWVGQL
jgi:hypothetical protein